MFRNLKNFLTHAYITTPEYIEENLKESLKMYKRLKEINQNISKAIYEIKE
ncbi:hypothetical protein [Caminibacter sp.]